MELIGYRPKNWSLFFESLLHRPYLQYHGPQSKSNERLEFLGDAILNFLVAEYLYRTYPLMEEGDLTKVRSRVVYRNSLAQRAKELRLSDFLLLSSSALQSVDSGSDSILADAFESIIGALYIDGGLDPARGFVSRALLSDHSILNSALTDDNYKSALLEYAQARSLGVPRYAIVREEGPDHDRRFTIEVSLAMRALGPAPGAARRTPSRRQRHKRLSMSLPTHQRPPNYNHENDDV